jgi:hypothetical protein
MKTFEIDDTNYRPFPTRSTQLPSLPKELTVNNAPVNAYNAQHLDKQSSREDNPAHIPREAKAMLCPVLAIVMYTRCSKERGAIEVEGRLMR